MDQVEGGGDEVVNLYRRTRAHLQRISYKREVILEMEWDGRKSRLQSKL